MNTVDIAYAEEWLFDHGIAVPLSFLTPRRSSGDPGEHQLPGPPLTPCIGHGRSAKRCGEPSMLCRRRSPSSGTGGDLALACHPPGKINWEWDQDFMAKWCDNDRDALLEYDDLQVYADAGQGGFEIDTFLAVNGSRWGTGHGALHGTDPDRRGQLHHCPYDLSTPVRRMISRTAVR